jgi:hypothetical protein
VALVDCQAIGGHGIGAKLMFGAPGGVVSTVQVQLAAELSLPAASFAFTWYVCEACDSGPP